MNKWIETYMQVNNLKPNEYFRLCSQTFKGEYYFNEIGELYRVKGNGYEIPSMEIWGRLMSGMRIEKVNPSGRYIPRKGEYYWFVGICGGIIESRYNTEQDEFAIKHNLVFMTKEEAEDYKWFLDQVDKYKKEFVTGQPNYRLCFDFEYNKLFLTKNDHIKHHKDYFGNIGNIKEFCEVVGDDRIKKYIFGVWK